GSRITDLVSFYHVGVKAPDGVLPAAWASCVASQTGQHRLLLARALSAALEQGATVFNALDVERRSSALHELGFLAGTGRLGYHLYNWSCPEMSSDDVGLSIM